jgi:hypothetical protein
VVPAQLNFRLAIADCQFLDCLLGINRNSAIENSVSLLKLKIDVSGTVGDAAWREIRQFDQIQSADFGPQFGSGGRCNHPPDTPHAKGEWIGAEIRLQTPLLAQYAMSHYLEQERVLDADVE